VFEYSAPHDGHVSLEVLDQFGDRVAVPARGWTGRGIHVAEWDPREKAPGRYRLRLRAAGHQRTAGITLV